MPSIRRGGILPRLERALLLRLEGLSWRDSLKAAGIINNRNQQPPLLKPATLGPGLGPIFCLATKTSERHPTILMTTGSGTVQPNKEITALLDQIEADVTAPNVPALLEKVADSSGSGRMVQGKYTWVLKSDVPPLTPRCVKVITKVLEEKQENEAKKNASTLTLRLIIRNLNAESNLTAALKLLRTLISAATIKESSSREMEASQSALSAAMSLFAKILEVGNQEIIAELEADRDLLQAKVIEEVKHHQPRYMSKIVKWTEIALAHPELFTQEKVVEILEGASVALVDSCDRIQTLQFSFLLSNVEGLFNLLGQAGQDKLSGILLNGIKGALNRIVELEKAMTKEVGPRGERTYETEEYELIASYRKAKRSIIGSLYNAVAAYPETFGSLTAEIVVRLFSGGLLIPDSAIIQEKVSAILHAAREKTLGSLRLLARATPYSFRVIGAQSNVDSIVLIPEQLDNGKDPLMRVMRIDIHAGQNRDNLDTVSTILRYWRTQDRRHLEPLKESKAFLLASNEFPEFMRAELASPEVGELSLCLNSVLNEGETIADLATLTRAEVDARLAPTQTSEKTRTKVSQMVALLTALTKKYGQGTVTAEEITEFGPANWSPLTRPEKDAFGQAVAEMQAEDSLKNRMAVLLSLVELRKGIKEELLMPREMKVELDLHEKRHVAPGREAVMGTYKESKFDLFNYDRRLEVFGLELAERIRDENVTQDVEANLAQVRQLAIALIDQLSTNGIATRKMEILGETLELPKLSDTQVVDVFHEIIAELGTIIDKCNETFADALSNIGEVEQERIKARILRENREMEVLGGLAQNVLDTINSKASTQDIHDVVLPRSLSEQVADEFYFLAGNGHEPEPLPFGHARFGSKGANLVELVNAGRLVPPAVLISSALFAKAFERGITSDITLARELHIPPEYEQQIKLGIERIAHAEQAAGRDPGLITFSVRSGSFLSLPGLMETITNISVNEKSMLRASGNPWFVYDCMRRFYQDVGMAWANIPRVEFDSMIEGMKLLLNVEAKAGLNPNAMNKLQKAYRNLVLETGFDLPRDPFDQIMLAIKLVLVSWFNDRSVAERDRRGISHDWGTGITLQAMRYGNISEKSGAGVLFTSGLEEMGAFVPVAQGADVVDGLTPTIKIRGKGNTVQTLYPGVYDAIARDGRAIEGYFRSPTELEITTEQLPEQSEPVLWELQARGARHLARTQAPSFAEPAESLTKVADVSFGFGGAVHGVAVLEAERVAEVAATGQKPIYIGNYLVPDQAPLVAEAVGLASAKGGPTTHMAVSARNKGVTMVGGFNYDEVIVSGIKTGDPVSIDGYNRLLVMGHPEIRE